jgi:hypothetical protein
MNIFVLYVVKCPAPLRVGTEGVAGLCERLLESRRSLVTESSSLPLPEIIRNAVLILLGRDQRTRRSLLLLQRLIREPLRSRLGRKSNLHDSKGSSSAAGVGKSRPKRSVITSSPKRPSKDRKTLDANRCRTSRIGYCEKSHPGGGRHASTESYKRNRHGRHRRL